MRKQLLATKQKLLNCERHSGRQHLYDAGKYPAFFDFVSAPFSSSAHLIIQEEDEHHTTTPLPSHAILAFLNECTQRKDLTYTRRLHLFIVSNGLQSLSLWADQLIRLLTLFGLLQESIQVFHRVSQPTIYTWHAIIAAHVKVGQCDKALDLFCAMQQAAILPDKVTFLSILQACSSVGVMSPGMMIHDHIIRGSLERDLAVANTLIHMYATLSCIDEARGIFEKLSSRSMASWGAMIGGFVKNGSTALAFDLFRTMQAKKIKPNNIVFSCILKGCDHVGALELGRCIHVLAVLGCIDLDNVVVRALMDMYINCGCFEEALKVFEGLGHVDLKSLSSLILGYSDNGLGVPAFHIFKKMQEKGWRPDRVVLLCMCKACKSTRSSTDGRIIHDQIIIEGHETHKAIGNALIDMYATCGSVDEARNVFDRVRNRDVVSWGTMISGYVQHNHNMAVLKLFSCMQQKGIEPDKMICLSILKVYGNLGYLVRGRSIHNRVIQNGHDFDDMVGSSLIDMYGRSGSFEEALCVFNSVPDRNMVSWAALISSYLQHGHDLAALELYKKMQRNALKPDEALCVALLKSCIRVGSVDVGRSLHDQLKGNGGEVNVMVANVLIEMYSKCGCIVEAEQVFDRLQVTDVTSWGVMMTAYVESDCFHLALSLFEQMQEHGAQPDKTVYISLCKAYGSIRDATQGNGLYDAVIKAGLDSCLVVGSCVIDMYARCARMKEADNVFSRLREPDIVCWGALLSGYIQHGHPLAVFELLNKMQDQGIEMDRVTFLSALNACGTVGDLEQGMLIHQRVVDGAFDTDMLILTAVVDMYAKCGSFEEVHRMLDSLKHSDILSRGALMSSCAHHGNALPALQLFATTTQEDGIEVRKATFLFTLKACSIIGAIEEGRLIHDQIVRSELEAELAVGNSLIDMYAKCGCQEEAHRVFDRLSDKDITSWSATIAAYASQGKWDVALRLLSSMKNHGIKPDDSMFISILSACSRHGLLKEGCQFFMQIERVHGLSLRVDHFNCIIDTLGRGGVLSEAEDMLKTMPVMPSLVSWKSLLTGCGVYGNKGLGGHCFGGSKQLRFIDGDCDHFQEADELSYYGICAEQHKRVPLKRR